MVLCVLYFGWCVVFLGHTSQFCLWNRIWHRAYTYTHTHTHTHTHARTRKRTHTHACMPPATHCINARPTKMKAFKNREGIDFDLAEELECVQEWELPEAPPENTTGIE